MKRVELVAAVKVLEARASTSERVVISAPMAKALASLLRAMLSPRTR